jgi:hypothetical protein
MTYQEIVYKYARQYGISIGRAMAIMHTLGSKDLPYKEKIKLIDTGNIRLEEVNVYESVMSHAKSI